jgi:hypothetical protein
MSDIRAMGFDPSPDVDAFVAELERYLRSDLQSAPMARRIGESTCP